MLINKVLLRDLLRFHFNEAELRSMCFELGIEFGDLGSGSILNKFEALIEAVEHSGKVNDLIKITQAARSMVDWEKIHMNDPVEQIFPFTNRRNEIDLIMQDTPSHRIIQAPMGYGKTALCEQLQAEFEQLPWQERWICRYIIIKGDNFNLVSELSISKRELNKNGRDRLMIIFDLDNQPFLSIFNENEINQLVDFDKNLGELNQRLRIVFVGRRFSNQTFELLDKLKNYSSINLSPFNHYVITESIVEYLRQNKYRVSTGDQQIQQLAAHLLFLTGGHPGCLSELIRLYQAGILSVDQFVDTQHERILEGVVYPTLDSIINEVDRAISDKAVRQFLQVNLLRYNYYPILEKIIDIYKLPDVTHPIKLADKLTTARLYEWSTGYGFLEDGIFQQLAVMRLWNREPENFRRYGRIARRICKAYLKMENCQRPVLWTTEYLYQVLQAHAPKIMDPATRQLLRKRLFEQFLPGILNILFLGRNKSESLTELKKFIENDKTFQFTINYFLRENRFTNEPYETLLADLDQRIRECYVEN